MTQDPNAPERPRSEPEIIPPGESRSAWRAGGTFYARGKHGIRVVRIRPLGAALLTLVLAILVAVILLLALGAVLIWIPVVAVIAIVAAVSGLFRLLR